jgi:hypothetical protein
MPLTTEVTASVTWDQALEAITRMSERGSAEDFAEWDVKRLELAVKRIREKVAVGYGRNVRVRQKARG